MCVCAYVRVCMTKMMLRVKIKIKAPRRKSVIGCFFCVLISVSLCAKVFKYNFWEIDKE